MVEKGDSIDKFCLMIFLFQGGKSARVVNTVLALKSYDEWKQGGGYGVWKFGGNVKPTTTLSATKSFVRKNSEPFTNSLSRTSSLNDKSFNSSNAEWNKTVSTVDSFTTLCCFCCLFLTPTLSIIHCSRLALAPCSFVHF